jgi:hypothetical protein
MSIGCSGSVKGGLKQGHGTAVGIPRGLQEPIFVGALFGLKVDFWSIFSHFWSILEVAGLPFYGFI